MEQIQSEQLNWVGLKFHKTDYYVHWKDKNPVEEMNKLRTIYDKIVSLGVDELSIDLLLDAAYNMGRSEECDANNPDL